jgi:intracellular multiplication protein IcmD
MMKKYIVRASRFFMGIFGVLLGAAFSGNANAQETVSTLLTSIQSGILSPLLDVIVGVAYLAGAGFVVAAIFKFKAHKDNPTQVTVGTPVMLLFVGIGLLFFPTLIKSVMSSIGITGTGGSVTFSGGSVTTANSN